MSVELFHRLYAMLDGLADALRVPGILSDALELLVLYFAETFLGMFNLVMSPFPALKSLKEKKNRKIWNQIAKKRHGGPG